MPDTKVLLRAMNRSDLDRVRLWGNDPEVAAFLDRVRPISEVEHERWFEKMAQDPDVFLFAIEDSSAGRHIGNVWLCNLDYRHRKGEIRILIGERDCWGKGFGRQAIRELVEFGFKKLNLHKIYAYVVSNNPRSRAMFESCGFQVEGMLKEEYYVNGTYVDGYRLGVVKEGAVCAE